MRFVTFLLPLLQLDMTQAWTSPVTCISWDGVVSDTANWRMEQGIEAALGVWPFLVGDNNSCGVDGIGDSAWLRNKIRAVAPYLGGLECNQSAEYALLVRLLLEEQQLDPSVGKKGKYASKFHPQGPKAIAIPSARSSRPLTVGEIQANWIEYLLDTVLVKYAVDNKNPVPILQEFIDHLVIRPPKNALLCDAIQDFSCHSQVVIAVSCESELPIAIDMLPSIDVIKPENQGSSTGFMVGSELSIIKALCEQHSEVRFVGSNWAALQNIKRLVDVHPRLRICLASWTSTVAQMNHARMDPVVGLVTEDEFLELLSARIITAP